MIRVVSLFAGIGAADLGLYAAAEALGVPVQVVAAYDSWEPAVRVYNRNLPHPVAEVCDLKKIDAIPDCDLVTGGPPCQPFSLAGKRKGHGDERNCLPDFVRLVGARPYIMENVVARLINAPWSERLCAADFGDVTSRKRWFYSNYLLHVIPTPGPRRIRDIRDYDEDARVLAKRLGDTMEHDIRYNPGGSTSFYYCARCADMGNTQEEIRRRGPCKPKREVGSGKLLEIVTHRPRIGSHTAEPYPTVAPMNGVFGSLTADAPRAYCGETLKLGLRGNSASASAFEDDEILGSVLSNSFHANETSKLVGCRNPSLLEMARAHSIPDSFDWCGATKTQRGQMIANSIPVGMATAVCLAMLMQLAREKGLAA